MTNDMDILLVEDNPQDVEITLRAFQKHRIGGKIHVVRDGEEALECLFCTGRYADRSPCAHTRLILLDLKLPKVDGLEILQKCKSDPRTKHIPVVVLTSSREEKDLEKSYGYGVNSYVVKPVDFPQFSDTVRQLGLYWMMLNQLPAELPV
ncbi:MAG TPA: response regulator [Nitrospira sp.]|jgi:CheY-like chemotaxis protein|nr:response regulator [Nitrospira sp.]